MRALQLGDVYWAVSVEDTIYNRTSTPELAEKIAKKWIENGYEPLVIKCYHEQAWVLESEDEVEYPEWITKKLSDLLRDYSEEQLVEMIRMVNRGKRN